MSLEGFDQEKLGLFFAKFDDTTGPLIEAQYPPGYISPDLFDSISEYVITRKELYGSFLTVTCQGKRIVSYPLLVENTKIYNRNAFLFAFGLVFPEGAKSRHYHPILRKLGEFMRSMEEDSQYLSTEETKIRFCAEILPTIARGLSSSNECVVSLDDNNILALKLTPRLKPPPEIKLHEVPVQVKDLNALVTQDWDLTLQQVIPFIDGVKSVSRIASEAKVDRALVRRCLQQLVYYKCVVMIDIFQYSNMYMCTKKIVSLLEPEVQRQCLQYITKGVEPFPTVPKVIQLYCSLHPSLALVDFCARFDFRALNIDEKRFITFGVVNGLIRRVHKYPVRLHTPERDPPALLEEAERRMFAALALEAVTEAEMDKRLERHSSDSSETLTVPLNYNKTGFKLEDEDERTAPTAADRAAINAQGNKYNTPIIPVVDDMSWAAQGGDAEGTSSPGSSTSVPIGLGLPTDRRITFDPKFLWDRLRVQRIIDGNLCYDEICQKLWMAAEDVDLVLKYDSTIAILHK